MAKRIGPEAKIIQLFTALPEDSKRIVMDLIKSQTAKPRKASVPKSAPSAERKSSRKEEGTQSTASTKGITGSAGSASKAPEAAVLLPDNPEEFKHGATA